MIICNLKQILKKSGLTITKLSNYTGISRPTLTALAHNTGNGIQYDTLNSLCFFLSIEPNELLTYLPFDIEFSVSNEWYINEFNAYDYDIKINLTHCSTSMLDIKASIVYDDESTEEDTYYSLDIEDKYLSKYQRYIAHNLNDKQLKVFLNLVENKIIEFLNSQSISNPYIDMYPLHKWTTWQMFDYLEKKNS